MALAMALAMAMALASAKDLVLPKTVGGYLDLRGLNGMDRKYLKDKFGM